MEIKDSLRTFNGAKVVTWDNHHEVHVSFTCYGWFQEVMHHQFVHKKNTKNRL